MCTLCAVQCAASCTVLCGVLCIVLCAVLCAVSCAVLFTVLCAAKLELESASLIKCQNDLRSACDFLDRFLNTDEDVDTESVLSASTEP